MIKKYCTPIGKGQTAIGVGKEIAEMVKVIWQMGEINLMMPLNDVLAIIICQNMVENGSTGLVTS